MLSGSSDRTLKLWDTETGNLLRTFNGHSDRIWTVGFSPDGVHVLSGSFDRTAKLWDANTGQLLHTFDGNSGWVIRSVAFSPSGAQLATADSNGEIHLWNTASRELVRTLHSTPVESVAFSPDGRRLVTGGDDTTTKIWDLASGSLLASLSATADGDWLAMTPAGFFSASRSATEMLGVVRGYDYWSIQQFYEHLYRPDLFDEVMKGDPEGKYKDEAFRLNLEKILEAGPAPQIEHLKQRDGRAGDTIQLTVRLTDTGGGIGKKVIWRINGQTRAVSTPHLTSGGATDKALTVTTSLRVDPGQNTLVEVTAYNRAELLATLPLQISVDKFGATAEERPSMHVLAIGVNRYRMAEFQLRYAVKDATAIGEALAKVGGALLGSDNVFVTTLTDEQVSAHDIESAFGRIAARAKLGDVFVLFLSGHGKSIAGRYYYYPQTLDFSQGHKVEEHGIGQDALQQWIAGIPAQKKVLIIDTCESSAAAGLVRGDAPRRTAMDHLQHATGDNLIAASRQAAFEGYQGHGVLTYALLEAMHKTEGRGNDQIRVSTLARFAERRVPEISYQLTGFDQKPTRKLTGDNFPIGLLATVLSPPTTDAIPKTPTHVLVRIERVRAKPEAGALGERELAPGAQVRIVKFDGAWAMVAIDGQELGYVPSEALARLH